LVSQVPRSKLAGSLNVFFEKFSKSAEFFSKNFGKIKNNLIYAEVAQVL
jgi:hypothetical protein